MTAYNWTGVVVSACTWRGRHGFESSARVVPFFLSLTACHNVRTCGVVTRLWHCGNNFKSKVFATLWLLSDKVVTIDNHNLLTRLSQPCHNLVISIWVVQCNFQNGQLYILASSIIKKNLLKILSISVASNVSDSFPLTQWQQYYSVHRELPVTFTYLLMPAAFSELWHTRAMYNCI